MVDSTLTNLTAGAAPVDADLFYTVQAGGSRKVTGLDLKTYATSSVPVVPTTANKVLYNNAAGVLTTDHISYTESTGQLTVGSAGTSVNNTINGVKLYGSTSNVAFNKVAFILNAQGADWGAIGNLGADSTQRWFLGSSINADVPNTIALSWDASTNVYLPAKTAGSVPFFGAGGLISQDNANFFWDNTAKVLILTGGEPLRVTGSGEFGVNFVVENLFGGSSKWSFGVSRLALGYEFFVYQWEQDRTPLATGLTGASNDIPVVGTNAKGAFGWNGSARYASGLSYDTAIFRDGAAGRVAIRKDTTAHSFRVYNTWTDASNYERGILDWQGTSNVLTIGTEAAGTGSTRNLKFIIGGATQLDYGITTASTWNFTSAIKVTPVAVASLPAAGTAGRRHFVTDANATTFASVVAGGGANNVPVYDDGTNWLIG